MPQATWLIAVTIAIAACSASGAGGPSLIAPMDGGPRDTGGSGVDDAGADSPPTDAPIDASTDAAIDAPIDVPPDITDLAVICGGAAPVTFDEWEDCYEKRKCEWEVGCFPPYPFRDVADCVASGDAVSGGQLGAARRERKRAVEQGRASINVDAFTHCLIRTNATHCDTAFHEPACLTRFAGTIADDETCFADIDCMSSGAVCDRSCPDACCLGSCRRKLREGEQCSLSESCEPGLLCPGLGTKCISGDVGTPCDKDSTTQCDFGTFCDSQELRCTPTLAPGAACTSGLQCGDDYTCVGLSIVRPDPGHCRRISKPGDRCDGFCFGNLYCETKSRTCQSFPVLGEACSLFVACAGVNAICDNGICVPRSDVGVSCGGQTCLPGLFCTSELGDPNPTCSARRADGEPCTAPGHCESYLCSGDASQAGVCLPWSDMCPSLIGSIRGQ